MNTYNYNIDQMIERQYHPGNFRTDFQNLLHEVEVLNLRAGFIKYTICKECNEEIIMSSSDACFYCL